jgi:hypothetical protein
VAAWWLAETFSTSVVMEKLGEVVSAATGVLEEPVAPDPGSAEEPPDCCPGTLEELAAGSGVAVTAGADSFDGVGFLAAARVSSR